MTIDFLIVGQGLAGSLLAWNLMESGCAILVVDESHAGSATKVGAGIINPVTGPRITPCWRLEPLLADCRKTYRLLGQELGRTYYREKELVRVFKSDEERHIWMQKRSGSGTNRYLGAMKPPGWKPEVLLDPWGSFSPGDSGRLEMGNLIDDIGRRLENKGCLLREKFSYREMELGQSDVRWKNNNVGKVIFCQGFRAKNNPWFRWLPFKPAKGEILDLKIAPSASKPLRQILNCGKWLLPLGENTFRAGSTYCWDPIDTVPTTAGKDEIMSGLEKFLKLAFEVTGHRAGVRPIVKDYKPVLGLHPEHAQLGIFNGLGSKGALMAPFFARQMANFLKGEATLEEEINLQRFT